MNLNISTAPDLNIPMVLAPTNTNPTPLLDLINNHRIKIIDQLSQYGAILFRGFACQDAEYFSNAIKLCNLGSRCSTTDYDIARTLLPDEIYTSSDLPAHIPLPLHHEKPRSKNPPNHLYFCCVTPAEQGGGTLFANAESIWRDMPNTVQDKIIQYGVLYKQFFHGNSIKYSLLKKVLNKKSARSWSDYFGTFEKSQIEQQLQNNEVTLDWVNNGKDLILSNPLPGARIHPISGQTLWFNSSAYLNYYSNLIYGELRSLGYSKYCAARYLILKDRLPMICHYGNEQAFSADEITKINRILQQHTRVLNWQKGDFMIVDNYTFMHGKQAHRGDRLLYSCMSIV